MLLTNGAFAWGLAQETAKRMLRYGKNTLGDEEWLQVAFDKLQGAEAARSVCDQGAAHETGDDLFGLACV
jgi:hypothetical protein